MKVEPRPSFAFMIPEVEVVDKKNYIDNVAVHTIEITILKTEYSNSYCCVSLSISPAVGTVLSQQQQGPNQQGLVTEIQPYISVWFLMLLGGGFVCLFCFCFYLGTFFLHFLHIIHIAELESLNCPLLLCKYCIVEAVYSI